MYGILETDLELVVADGFIYMPLLLDPDVASEAAGSSGRDDGGGLVEAGGARFIRALSLDDLPENYPKLHPGHYRRLREEVLRGLGHGPPCPAIDEKLPVILFEVMPHFIHKKRGLKRGGFTEEEMLGLVRERLGLKDEHHAAARQYLDLDSLRDALQRLQAGRRGVPPPPEGPVRARRLKEWLFSALKDRVVADEAARLERAMEKRRAFARADRDNLAALLHVAQRGWLEIDGCGFYRSRYPGEYVVYKRTGEYALQDYYGRVYLFPDCRVGVSTWGPFTPVVLEEYKHPFLHREGPYQQVCMRRWTPPRSFSAKGVIAAIEEGINSLLYGYNFRRRNGYHSLDRVTLHFRSVDFDDLVVPPDHPGLASGEVRVTNG